MNRGVGVQIHSNSPQQPQYQPPPQQRATQPPRSSGGRKVASAIIGLIVLVAILYVVFVPKVIEREEVREAQYEIVSENQDVRDEWECIRWSGFIFVTCQEYAWVRYVSTSVNVRAIEMSGDYVVTAEVTSGLNLTDEKITYEYHIYENDVRTYYFSYPSFKVTEYDHEHNANYVIDISVSAPKTVEKKKLTIFESLF